MAEVLNLTKQATFTSDQKWTFVCNHIKNKMMARNLRVKKQFGPYFFGINQDLWEVSANLNKFFVMFATHSSIHF